MAPSNSVKLLEITGISPYSDSPNSVTEFSLPLTFFDTFWFKLPPVERLFFYQHTESTQTFFDSVTLPKLKQSLSLTLHHYLPLAGRLKWDPSEQKPIILYTPNDTVSFTVAESTADLTRLSNNETREAPELHPFIPELSVSNHIASIMSLQITLFPGQGFCIGITTHHGIVDGQTATMFIKSWACLCKQQQQQNPSLPKELSPFFYRSVIKDPDEFDLEVLNGWLTLTWGGNSDPNNNRNLNFLPNIGVHLNLLVRATFVFTREDIKKLRERMLLQNDVLKQNSKQLHLSTFVLSYAYMLTCMVKAKGGSDSNRNVVIAFTADYRTRLDPPVPVNYFGNCVAPLACIAKAGDFIKENGFDIAVEKISDMVSGLDKEVHESIRKILSMFANFESGTQAVSVAGSIRFEVYGSDFGWGKPRKVEIVSIDRTGAISMAESGDGSGGVEVGLCLSRHEMEIFTSLFVDGLKDL